MKTILTLLFVPVALAAGVSLSAAQSAPVRSSALQVATSDTPPMPAPALTPATMAPPASYVIGPLDVLKITVVDEGPDMRDQSAVVAADGTIAFWALRNIPASGKTLSELQDKIAALLADGYIKNPVVRAEIDKYKSQYVTIVGEVRTPSRIPMMASKSLLEALTDAGGQTSQAASEAEVSHTNGHKETIDLKDYQAAQAFLLKDGDVVLVPKAQTFYINGEVRNQGMIVWQRNMTLSQAVTLAGGLSDRGSYRSAEATRVVNGKTAQVDLKPQSPVMPDDVITIHKRIF